MVKIITYKHYFRKCSQTDNENEEDLDLDDWQTGAALLSPQWDFLRCVCVCEHMAGIVH